MTYPTKKKKNSTFVQNLLKNCLLVLFIYKKIIWFLGWTTKLRWTYSICPCGLWILLNTCTCMYFPQDGDEQFNHMILKKKKKKEKVWKKTIKSNYHKHAIYNNWQCVTKKNSMDDGKRNMGLVGHNLVTSGNITFISLFTIKICIMSSCRILLKIKVWQKDNINPFLNYQN